MKIEVDEPIAILLAVIILASVWCVALLMTAPSETQIAPHTSDPAPHASDPAVDVERCRESCDAAYLEMFEVAFSADGSLSECRCSAILGDME